MSKKLKIGGFKTQLWQACSTDELRAFLNCAFVDNGKIVATNAHILIVQDLEEVHGIDPEQAKIIEGKFFHRELLKEMEKCEIITFTEDGIDFVKGSVKGTFYYTEIGDKFPNWHEVVGGFEPCEVSQIGVNPKVLKSLTETFSDKGNNGVKLEFQGRSKYIRVSTESESITSEYGIIMPIMIMEG